MVHSAAVGDYELASPSKEKIPSQQKELLIRLQPTPKILDKVKDWSPSSFLISFKAASPETSLKELEKIAQKQRERSRSDIVFANILGQIGRDVLIVLPERSMYFKTREEAMKRLTTRIAEKLS